MLGIPLCFVSQSYVLAKDFIFHAPQVEGSPTAVWMLHTYEEVFRRLNIPMKVLYLPNVRGAVMTEFGEIDGQLSRFAEYGSRYQNQIRVDEPVYVVTLVAVVHKETDYMLTGGWEALQNTPLHIDYVRGALVTEKNLEQRLDSSQLSAVSFIHEGLVNLKYHNSDVFIHGYASILPYLSSEEFKDELKVAAVIEVVNLYPYVNIKYGELVPLLKKTLADVKAEGLPFKYCLEAFGRNAKLVCNSIVPMNAVPVN